jgi:hypothetical protein
MCGAAVFGGSTPGLAVAAVVSSSTVVSRGVTCRPAEHKGASPSQPSAAALDGSTYFVAAPGLCVVPSVVEGCARSEHAS